MLEKALNIEGWMSQEELKVLSQMASRSSLILEIGCFKGRSTRVMADSMSGGMLYAVDPWGLAPYYDAWNKQMNLFQESDFSDFCLNLADHIASARVQVYRMLSAEFCEQWNSYFKFDFIFLDAGHREVDLVQDIEIARRLLKDGGVLAGHDYGRQDWPDVKKVIDEEFPKRKVVDTIWIQEF